MTPSRIRAFRGDWFEQAATNDLERFICLLVEPFLCVAAGDFFEFGERSTPCSAYLDLGLGSVTSTITLSTAAAASSA